MIHAWCVSHHGGTEGSLVHEGSAVVKVGVWCEQAAAWHNVIPELFNCSTVLAIPALLACSPDRLLR